MKSVDTLVPLNDILDLLQRIVCSEEVTVSQLLNRVEMDLKSDKKPIENLKALNYFMLHVANHCSSLDIYETLLKSCLNSFNYVEIKHKIHNILLSSILDSCFSCISTDKISEMFLYTIDFIVLKLEAVSSSNLSLENANIYHALLILEKLCNQVIIFTDHKLSSIFPESLVSQIIDLTVCLPHDASNNILATVIPKFILSQASNKCLKLISEKIEQSFIRDEALEKQLFYLCLLSDNFIVLTSDSISFPLYEKTFFWQILQSGLIDEKNLCRKQALYLLKRYISILEESEIELETEFFFWYTQRKPEMILFWNQMFVFLEVLEEKQTHLIMPAIKNFHDFYILCELNEKICYSWLYCVFFRIFCHSSTTLSKWGLREFCLLRTDLLFCDRQCNLLLSSFFKSLNNMFLYNTTSRTAESNLTDCLATWFISISENESNLPFYKIILENLVNSSWSPIPLFFIINSLTRVPKTHIWEGTCFDYIKKLLLETLKTQCTFIRSAIQCQLLKCITQLSKPDIEIPMIINILGHFNGQESLCRGTGMWYNCIHWLKSILSFQNGLELINLCTDRIFSMNISTVSIQSYARGIVLFSDVGVLPKTELITLFVSINEQFVDCDKRIYSCPKKQNRCAEFLKCIINEWTTSSEIRDPSHDLLMLVQSCSNNLLTFVGLKLKRGPIDSLEEAELYEAISVSLLSNLTLLNIVHSELFGLYTLALNMLQTENLPFFTEFVSLRTVFNCFSCLLSNNFELPLKEDIIRLIFINRLFNKDSDQGIWNPVSEPNLKGKLMSERMKTIWSIFSMHLKCNSQNIRLILDRLPISMVTNYALSAICEDGKQALIPILKSFVILLPCNANFDLGIQLITKSWHACFELRKSELFWLAITEWIAMVYQEKIVIVKEYQEIICNHAKKIMELGEELVGLVDIFIDHLNTFHITPEFAFIVSEGLTFGGLTRKDKRMEQDVCYYIMKKVKEGKMESFGKWNNLRNDKEVRLKAMNLLLKPGDFKMRNDIIKFVINDLLHSEEALSKNSRYFNDSITHRRKHRILQALLILEHYIFNHPSQKFQDLPRKIFDWAFKSIQGTNQQPSVRYQLEWLFILLNVHYPDFLKTFWHLFEKAGEDRIGSMCSFISIAYHLAVILKDDTFLEKCIESIVPWCMSQNFNIRLYAQVTLSKLWDLNLAKADRYKFIRTNQWKTCEQGNMLVNAKKMQSDFYFSIFHPIHHFTLQTLFWDLPRLANISSEEWIHPEILIKYSHFSIDCQLSDVVPSLESCVSPTWLSRSTGEAEEKGDGSTIQKKFIPWKGMFLNSDNMKEETNKSGIIVVASLIDKAANLGGLARTCEVFAAKELILPSLEITKDKEFIGLSMTAEKHLYITEVRPYNLQEYLKFMKSLGYSLIGAEQTTGSVSLTSYRFPQDCILLLGSEREGIPANLIPLLDFCVEIPQLGVIRSLNVHVSGALLLWEYSKQHSLKPS